MKNKTLKKILAFGIAIVMSFSLTGVFADSTDEVVVAQAVDASYVDFDATYIEIVPFWTHIISTSNLLQDLGGGRLRISGDTSVWSPNRAGLTIELQQNGSTIRTWSAPNNPGFTAINTEHFVARGHQYRLRLTHRALDASGRVLETVVFYSRIVIPL